MVGLIIKDQGSKTMKYKYTFAKKRDQLRLADVTQDNRASGAHG